MSLMGKLMTKSIFLKVFFKIRYKKTFKWILTENFATTQKFKYYENIKFLTIVEEIIKNYP